MQSELPDPVEEMAQLDWFLGKWDVVSKMKDSDGAWHEDGLQTDHREVLGGHVILEHFGGPLMGQPFEAWSLRKFNPTEQRWEQRWVDTSPGGFADWTGHWDEVNRRFVGHPNRVLNDEGKVANDAVREVFFDIGDDGFSWKYETTDDAGQSWSLAWSLEYRRTND